MMAVKPTHIDYDLFSVATRKVFGVVVLSVMVNFSFVVVGSRPMRGLTAQKKKSIQSGSEAVGPVKNWGDRFIGGADILLARPGVGFMVPVRRLRAWNHLASRELHQTIEIYRTVNHGKSVRNCQKSRVICVDYRGKICTFRDGVETCSGFGDHPFD
jgi:hypothetical protein